MTPRTWSLPFLVAALLASVVLTFTPAQAASAMPRIMLTGGAAQVSRTYTATAYDRSFPSGSTPRYQWYRGNHQASSGSFYPISGATGKRYTLRDADHWYTVKVVVKAVRNGYVVGQNDSATTNWIMYNMAPPVLSGTPHVGQTITAKLGIWATEWDTSLWWRRTGNPIPGENRLTYKVRAADAGKEISLLAIGEYHFPNGVHPIDRYAARMRMVWGTKAILKGASNGPGKLGLTAIAYAQGAPPSAARGRLAIYDGSRLVKRTYIQRGNKVVRLSGLRRGTHKIKMVFVGGSWFAGSRVTRTFTVR